ncbi:putative uncharacterized protein DDB_G0279653 [Sitodiplosis mosellana]|uniref:putative uncharacterized protein DDB_G0279653 n=1 Tax=Sitodiplosis mosellana TaxID=263140 RepID=UPI00244444ED|nr:putative uncharacterized protein DDB_G0279653 [Sitodiplosis mosellana]
MPLSNEHLYSQLYGRDLELMRKIYKGENRDHLVENPLMHSPHQPHNPDAMIMKNTGYPMNYPNAGTQFGLQSNSQYHHALSPSRTPPKMHHPEQIMSPDNTRMIKQEEKSVLFNSPPPTPSSYSGYGAASMSPTSLLGNQITRKFASDALHKQTYEDRKLHLSASYANKDHLDPTNYSDSIYADVMNASNSNINNFMHMQHEQHEKQPNQRHQHHHHHHHQNTTKHSNNSQLIGTESNNHFYNISDYESNDKRQQQQHHHSSHQLFQQNQFSINNTTPKDNGGANVNIATTIGLTEKSPINNTSSSSSTSSSKLNTACSHSDSNNNNNNSSNSNNENNAKNVRMTAKYSAAAATATAAAAVSNANASENTFENPCRTPAKMCAKSIKNDGTSKIQPNKVNNSNNATNLLPHSKCGSEPTNDFMLHIRVKEQKQHQMQQSANGRMPQQMGDFDETTSNSCSTPGNEDTATNYNDDEGDEFMNL